MNEKYYMVQIKKNNTNNFTYQYNVMLFKNEYNFRRAIKFEFLKSNY